MRLVLEGERRIRVEAVGGAALDVESAEPGIHLSPLHLLAASLATCTLAVLEGWAMQVGLDSNGLEIGIDWDYVEDPYRVGRYGVGIRWPDLPETRRPAALRVAEHCTVEHTLRHSPEIETRIEA